MANVERIDCGTAVTWGHHKKTCGQWFFETSSNYLNINGKVAKVIQGHDKKGAQAVELMDRSSSCCVTALKVISYVIIIFPLLALIVRTALRLCYKFYLLSPKELDAIRSEQREPELLAFYKENHWEIYANEDKLTVIRKTLLKSDENSSRSVSDHVWELCHPNEHASTPPADIESAHIIEALLEHKGFQPYIDKFIRKTFDCSTKRCADWCNFSFPAALAVLKVCVKMNRSEGPLSIIDPTTGRHWNSFIFAAANGHEILLNGLIDHFPDAFKTIRTKVTETLLEFNQKELIASIEARLKVSDVEESA